MSILDLQIADLAKRLEGLVNIWHLMILLSNGFLQDLILKTMAHDHCDVN